VEESNDDDRSLVPHIQGEPFREAAREDRRKGGVDRWLSNLFFWLGATCTSVPRFGSCAIATIWLFLFVTRSEGGELEVLSETS